MAKIIIVGPAHPFRGGIAAFNERLAKAFIDEGHDVEIVSFTLQYPDFLFPGKTQYSNEPKPQGINISSKINSVNPVSWLSAGMYIKKQNPDLVVFRYWLPFMAPALGTIARVVAKNKSSRIIAITDNVVPHEKRIGDAPLTRYFLNSCEGFVAMSKSVMEDLHKFVPRKPAIYQPHPLYDSFGKEKSREDALKNLGLDPGFNYILFFGFIRAYKGLDILLNAFADERLTHKKIKLIVAGEFYEDSGPYLELIADMNLAERLILETEFIPDSKVVDYFCAADLVVQPYKSATQSGVSQIAFHFNKPVIVTNVGGLAELVPNGKVGYVTSPDATEVANAIVDFFEENKKAEFHDNIIEYKKAFSWRAMTDALFKLASQVQS